MLSVHLLGGVDRVTFSFFLLSHYSFQAFACIFDRLCDPFYAYCGTLCHRSSVWICRLADFLLFAFSGVDLHTISAIFIILQIKRTMRTRAFEVCFYSMHSSRNDQLRCVFTFFEEAGKIAGTVKHELLYRGAVYKDLTENPLDEALKTLERKGYFDTK